MKHIQLSTVTPVYRGASYLEQLVERLHQVRASFAAESREVRLCEAIFVIDGATDNSLEILRRLESKYAWVKVIELSRNFGQHPATMAGILSSTGDWVATLDEDLQHRPEELEAMLRHAATNSLDIVFAKPVTAVHSSYFRDQSSGLLKKAIYRMSGNPHVNKFNSFRMMRGSICRAAASVASHDTYFDVALCWLTDRIDTFELVAEDERYATHGKSGYSFFGLLRHAKRLLITSNLKLLRLGTAIGFLSLVTSVTLGVGVLCLKIFSPESIQSLGWTSLSLMVLFFGGLISFLLGVALEYISHILIHSMGKPPFLIVEREPVGNLAGATGNSFNVVNPAKVTSAA